MKYKFFSRYIDKSRTYTDYEGYIFFEQNYWDDYGFETTFIAYKPQNNGQLARVGMVNTAKLNAKLNEKNKYISFEEPQLKGDLNELPEDFVTLGSTEFYINLHTIYNNEQCKEILCDLKDICIQIGTEDDLAQDSLSDFKKDFFKKEVINLSFFRDYLEKDAIELLKYTLIPLARNGERAGYDITYTFKMENKIISKVNFVSDPNMIFPQNVHAIIGKNGVGKTRFIKDILTLAITQSLKGYSQFYKNSKQMEVSFSSEDNLKVDTPKDYFSKVVFISFSPFDKLCLHDDKPIGNNGNVEYLGLYQKGKEALNIDDLSDVFTDTITKILKFKNEWDLFHEILVSQEVCDKYNDILFNYDGNEDEVSEVLNELKNIFSISSAGQKILLLSIATMIAEVEQYSLVLIDEPELFLHPPMISNYIRNISKIVRKKNGLCILTTHSPIIIQEIPKDCVKVMSIDDENVFKMDQPEYETLGENLSTLTNTIFELNQYNSGFYNLIKRIVECPEDFDLTKEDVKNLRFGRDGNLYRDLLMYDMNEEDDSLC